MTTTTYYPVTNSSTSVPLITDVPTAGFDPTVHQFPSLASTIWTRAKLDLKSFFRDKESMVWIFAFPMVFLALFSLMAGGEQFAHPDYPEITATFGSVFLPGLIAFGIMLSSFQSMAAWIAQEREKGGLKRLRATPLTPAAYFGGKILMVLITTLAQIALLIGLAVAFFGVVLPTGISAWLTFAWLLLLGSAAGTALGIVFSGVARTGKAVTNIASGLLTVLAFVSGVFMVNPNFPLWLTRVGQVFPMYWLTSGLRGVFLPAQMYAHIGSSPAPRLWLVAIILTAWALVGLVLAVRTFRWLPRSAK